MGKTPLIESESTVYFRDGIKKIDAILVYKTSKTSVAREVFLENLIQQKLEIEFVSSMFKEGIVFVKVHGSTKVLSVHASKHGIPLKYQQMTKLPEPPVPFKFLKNILNDPKPNPEHPVSKRAWTTISKLNPVTYTNCERSTIVFTIMNYTHYGTEPFQIGLSHLLLSEDFIAAYPLHDGKWEWPKDNDEPINDRQLLAEYWANFAMWHKQQPLNTIETYFGPEVAMYFAWLGFYNKMLIIASILGIVTVLYGVIHLNFVVSIPIKEACESEMQMCPVCITCAPKALKSYCWYYKIAFINDNLVSVLFACSMSFWATIFMEGWKRNQSKLEVCWNLNTVIDDVERPEFQARTNHIRTHQYTGELELFIPLRYKIMNHSVSILVVVFMICIVLATMLALILYECALKMYGVEKMYISLSSSFLTLFVMIVLRRVYGLVAWWLTNQECPRTQLEYEKSYMIKMIVFSIVNNYGKMIYIAFFKGKFFTYPGDKKMRMSSFPLAAEMCDPTGCVSEIFVLLAIITIFKPIISNFMEIMQPMIKVWIKKYSKKFLNSAKSASKILESWEQDYDLNPTNHFKIMEEIEEMVMQYGFVTLLVAPFPLAPFLALLNNIFEIRIDASKLVKYFRRPEASKSSSIYVWFDTLQAVTYMAIITNALYITFTSNFIPSMVYYFHYNKNMEGFYKFELSKFKIEDHYWYGTNITECWYTGHRYPPEDANAYQFTYLYFYILSCRLGFAIIFAITVLLVTAVIAYAIPDVPTAIKDLLAYNARKLRETMISQI